MTLLSKSVLVGSCLLAVELMISSWDEFSAADEISHGVSERSVALKIEQTRKGAPQQVTPPEESRTLVELSREVERDIRKAMQSKVDLSLKETELAEFVEFISANGHVPITINETALNEEGLTAAETMTYELHDVTIEQALNWTLPPFGLTWIIDNEVVKITTEVEANERLFTRTYKIDRLLKLSRKKSGALPDSDPTKSEFESAPPRSDPTGDWLTELLAATTTGPWWDVDGTGGNMTPTKGALVVRQTWKVHEEITSLISALHEVAKEESSGNAIAARPTTYPSAADKKITAALISSTSAKYTDRPLSSVVADIAKRHKIHIEILFSALAEEGLTHDEPVSLTRKNVALGSMLADMLEPLGLTFDVFEGALWITTELDAEEKLYTAVYDVSDLAKTTDDYSALIETIQQMTGGPWGMIDGTGGEIRSAMPLGVLAIRQTYKVHPEVKQLLHDLRQTISDDPKAAARPQLTANAVTTKVYDLSKMNAADDLLTAIPRFVAPNAWGEQNKTVAIQKVGETLVIRQTRAMHEQIERFLQQLGYYTRSGFGLNNQ